MPKYTIEINNDDLKVINLVKAIAEIKSVDKAISYILEDYSNIKSYKKILQQKR